MAGEIQVTIVGNVTADPEYRTTPSGATVVNFSVASSSRTFNRNTNSWEESNTVFMRCTAWRELADHIQSSITRGTRVIVQGRLTERQYTTQNGENRRVMELQVDEIGPSLRYATAQVQRVARQNGDYNYQNNGSQGNFAPQAQQNNAFAGYTGGASANQNPAPATNVDPWSTTDTTSYSNSFGATDFGASSDEPEF